ncbi:MAG: hypothetical protein PUB68_02090 [Lachnospiraceae bacterium]|nr:hypothetical protein [Lachnospiraceae bacterium]
MKKLAGLFLAATLTLSMTTVAFAAPSKSTTVSDGTTKEGATVSHVIKDDVKAAAGLVTDEKTGKVTLSDEQVSKVEEAIKVSKTDAESVDVKVLDVFDVQAPADYVEGTPIDITLDFPYSEEIQVLHFQDGQWVVLPTKEGADGKVVATFTKFSPTAIATVVVNSKKTEENVTPSPVVTPSDNNNTIVPSNTTTTDNNAIAPADNSKTPAATPASTAKTTDGTKNADATKKTGDVNTTVYVALLAAAAGACAIVIRRKMAR